MKDIAASEFKAKCLSILDEVQKTKRSVRITKFGKPVAELNPIPPVERKDLFGFMKGSVEILGDIISPASDPNEWEMLRD